MLAHWYLGKLRYKQKQRAPLELSYDLTRCPPRSDNTASRVAYSRMVCSSLNVTVVEEHSIRGKLSSARNMRAREVVVYYGTPYRLW